MTDLAERYDELCATPSDIFLHLPRFVGLVESLGADHVIELGSRSGVSTVAWLYALQQNGGHLTSIDLDPAPQIGTWSHWRHIQGNDLDPDVLAQLTAAAIILIDTSHTFAQTLAELNVYQHFVQPGGVIACHDTMLSHPEESPPTDPRFPVRRAIEQFCADNDREWLHIRDCWGLGVIKF